MQFTKAEEYGIFGVMYLANQNGDGATPLSEISEAQKIPEKFLAKIFQSLSQSGIVRSHRGVRGGFTLVKDPADITVKEVLETIHGPYHLMECLPNIKGCTNGRSDFCPLRELLEVAEERLVRTFSEHTIADLSRWEKNKSTGR